MRILSVLSCLLLLACNEETAKAPAPIALTASALGHYCQMDVLEHEGPKAQIHLSGYPMPIWFGQVRDGIAYVKSKERTADVLAFYVNDMAKATDWASPGTENWIKAETAFYVAESTAIGGMGAPEMVPFATADDARAFVKQHGGEIKRLSEIDAEDVLKPVDISRIASPTK